MRFVIGLVIGIVLPPLFAFCYLYLGYAPVATAAPPFPFERKIASMALNARIRKEAPKDAPIPVDEQNLMEGAKGYREFCAVCHGTSNQPETPTSRGMYPRPPQLFKGKGVTDDPPGETFWKAKNGIRLTGMPGYGESVSDTQLWQISILLANADKLPASVNAYLSSPLTAK